MSTVTVSAPFSNARPLQLPIILDKPPSHFPAYRLLQMSNTTNGTRLVLQADPSEAIKDIAIFKFVDLMTTTTSERRTSQQ